MYILEGKCIESLDEFQEEYFRLIAVRLLGHTDTNQCYFFNNDIEEASEIQAAIINNQLRLPALIVDAFDDTISESSDHLRNEISFNITVIDFFTPGNATELKQIRRKCRNLARKVVYKMLRDTFSHDEALLYNNQVFIENKSNIRGMYLGAVAGQHTGWTYEINWFVPSDLSFGLSELG